MRLKCVYVVPAMNDVASEAIGMKLAPAALHMLVLQTLISYKSVVCTTKSSDGLHKP